jgi:UDP-glucose 4-epimerase
MQWVLEPVADKISFERGSLLDLPAMLDVIKTCKINGIVHCGAILDIPYNLKRPYETYLVNTVGTINVLEAAKLSGVSRVVNLSSIAVYSSKQYEPMDENHPILLPAEGNSTGSYGASKAAAEIIAQSYWALDGVDCITLRLSAVYGYGMRNPIYVKPMVENAVLGKPTVFKTGGPMPRDYTYVKDVVQAIVKSLEIDSRKISQRIFLTTSGVMRTAAEVAETIKELIPDAKIDIGPELSEDEKINVKTRGALDISAAKEQLGYQPRYDLKTGITEYIEMFRRYISLSKGTE